MIRLTLAISVFFIYQFTSGQSRIPQVPSSVEIAEMKLKITEGARAQIQKDVNALRAYDKYFKIKLDRVNLYFPLIEKVLREEGVPDDLKYLSVQESSLIPDAVSSSDAVGYWQFKDFTAREVGMRVDHKIDERKNIISATRGAAIYLKRNNVFFDNWIYAINAYMTGVGGAKQFVNNAYCGKRQMTIDTNTHWYVKRFIAHVIAFRDEVGGHHSESYFLEEYTKGAHKDLMDIAKAFKVDPETLKEYNKWIKHGKIPDDKTYTVVVPLEGRAPRSKDNPLIASQKDEKPAIYPAVLTEEVINNKPLIATINGKKAIIASEKDNLRALAQKGNVPILRFEKLNDLQPDDAARTGQVYYLQSKRNRSPIRYHVVQPEESLWDISQKYAIKLDRLAKMNRMLVKEDPKPGRLLWLHRKRPSDTPVEYHNIHPDETPEPDKLIVKATPKNRTNEKVKEKEVEKLNEVKKVEPKQENPPHISKDKPSEAIAKAAPKRVNEPESGPRVTSVKAFNKIEPFKYHTVAEGETLAKIASFYNLSISKIMEWNELSSLNGLKEGQNLRLKTNKPINPIPKNNYPAAPYSAKNSSFHAVQPGESLWAIARQYGVSIQDIQDWNNLKTADAIDIGQELLLKKTNKIAQEGSTGSTGYATITVKEGDNLYKISRQYGMTVSELKKMNKLSSSQLSIGQKLKVTSR